jgi:hypothetical protein
MTTTHDGAGWAAAEAAAPELAARVLARFEATGLGYLATLRADGSPRISGVEPLFAAGELWLGMMPGSRKAADLRREPRFAFHAANADKQVPEGDAKLSGRAVPVDDDGDITAYRAAFESATGQAPPEGPLVLFRVEVDELTFTHVEGDELVLDWWRAGAPPRQTRRT